MEIEIDHTKKEVLLWIARADRDNPIVQSGLTKLYDQCKRKQYQVVAFYSGVRPLCESTSDLLAYNRKRLAELEVAQARLAL